MLTRRAFWRNAALNTDAHWKVVCMLQVSIDEQIPQGLKPPVFWQLFGTASAVPFQNLIRRQVLEMVPGIA